MKRVRRGWLAVAGAALLAFAPAPTVAQVGENGGDSATPRTVRRATFELLPNVRAFASPLADPGEPRFSIALGVTDLFETSGPERPAYTRPPSREPDVQAIAAIGGTIPLLRVGPNVVVGAQAGVFARFRIQRPSRDDMGQDWIVGMPIEMAWTDVSARLRVVHRSSHLGDEFAAATGAQRIEVGGEAVEGLFAYRLGRVRVYGGGGWIFHSNTVDVDALDNIGRSDRFTMQAGGDVELPFVDPHVSMALGADWQSAERTNWRSTFTAVGALRLHVGTREMRLNARYTGGASALGQFFLTPEEVWSLELQLGH